MAEFSPYLVKTFSKKLGVEIHKINSVWSLDFFNAENKDCVDLHDNIVTIDLSKYPVQKFDSTIMCFSSQRPYLVWTIGLTAPENILEFYVCNEDASGVWLGKTQFELLTGLKINIVDHVDN